VGLPGSETSTGPPSGPDESVEVLLPGLGGA